MKDIKLRRLIAVITLLLLSVSAAANENEKTIYLSSVNWSPYTGQTLLNEGLLSNLVSEAFARSGYRVVYRYSPWARAIQDAKSGVTSGVMAAYYEQDRTNHFIFPKIVWTVTEHFYSFENSPNQFKLNTHDISELSIAVVRHSIQEKQLIEEGAVTEPVEQIQQSVQMFVHGRVDTLLAPEPVVNYYLNTLGYSDVKESIDLSEKPFAVFPVYLAISKSTPNSRQIVRAFNEGLASIKNDGTYDSIVALHLN